MFLSTQFGKHFFPAFSLVGGVRVDYLSPTISVTDLLVIWLFVLVVREHKHMLLTSALRYKKSMLLGLLLGLLYVLSASRWQLAVFGLLKLSEFLFLGLFVARSIVLTHTVVQRMALILSVGVVGQSVLGIVHVLNQGSVGGILYFLGERTFTGQTPHIANASLNGELILRPYGTFPHPNVLAGYLVVSLCFIMFSLTKNKKHNFAWLFLLSLFLGTIGLLFTLSRVAIVLWIGVIAYGVVKMGKRNWIMLVSIISFSLIVGGGVAMYTPFFQRFLTVSMSEQAVLERIHLVRASFSLFAQHPILGIGIKHFVVELPTSSIAASFVPQPVHNIFLLILVETGILGFVLFGMLFFRAVLAAWRHRQKHVFGLMLFLIGVLGLFDHYFITIQQGQLLFTIVLGFCFARVQNKSFSQTSSNASGQKQKANATIALCFFQ